MGICGEPDKRKKQIVKEKNNISGIIAGTKRNNCSENVVENKTARSGAIAGTGVFFCGDWPVFQEKRRRIKKFSKKYFSVWECVVSIGKLFALLAVAGRVSVECPSDSPINIIICVTMKR